MSRRRPIHSLSGQIAVTAFLIAVLLVLTITLGVKRAHAAGQRPQVMCMPYKQMLAHAAHVWREFPIGSAIISDRLYIQFLSALDGATFTIIQVDTGGIACTTAAGFDLELARRPPHRES